MTTLQLYNTLKHCKESLPDPKEQSHIGMYVCGPTVYDRAHLGNARSVVVYDVLYRLLKHLYPNVTYVRNITDVDDKINNAAKEQKTSIQALTGKVIGWFHEDMDALGVLRPTHEPKATEHIGDMIQMISELIANGVAYVEKGHVLFNVQAVPSSASVSDAWYYGILSGRVQQDLDAGARVKVESYKHNPNDFVLWKPADAEDDPSGIFDSPWGKGRPGWHIECSAMSTSYLGADFDIHGGGSDLMFPHHENEIAQSIGAHPESHFARYWVHNGFLTVNGEKMSKSLGNFITVRNLLDKGVKGEVIRWALLKVKYNEPLNWNEKLLSDAKKELDYLYRAISVANISDGKIWHDKNSSDYYDSILASLKDDVNTPLFFAKLTEIAQGCMGSSSQDLINLLGYELKYFAELFGFLSHTPEQWFKGGNEDNTEIQSLIDARIAAKKAKNWAEADKIRAELKAQGILLEDKPDGSSDWRKE